MRNVIIALAMLMAAPAMPQSATDDSTSVELWWDKVGGEFFSAATLQTPRPESEIRAQWSGLSADDQAAVRARCAAAAGAPVTPPVSTQRGSDDNVTAPDDGGQTTTGSVNGVEAQTASRSPQPAPDTGLAGGQGTGGLVLICDLIARL